MTTAAAAPAQATPEPGAAQSAQPPAQAQTPAATAQPAAAGTQQTAPATQTQTPATGDPAAAAPARVVPPTYAFNIPTEHATFASDLDTQMWGDYAKREQMTQEEASAFANDQIAMRRATHTRLLEAAKAHGEIGGDNFEPAQRRAKAVLDRFLPGNSAEGQQLRSDLTRLGLSNYPPLAVLLDRIGKAIGEDTPITGATGTTPADLPTEQVLWPAKK